MKWSPIGLGGYGNMDTPAISRRVCPSAGPQHADMIVNCDMGGAYLSRDLGQTWRLLHYSQLHGNVTVRPAYSPRYGQIDGDWVLIAGSEWGDMRKSVDGGRTFASIFGDGQSPFTDQRLQGEIAI